VPPPRRAVIQRNVDTTGVDAIPALKEAVRLFSQIAAASPGSRDFWNAVAGGAWSAHTHVVFQSVNLGGGGKFGSTHPEVWVGGEWVNLGVLSPKECDDIDPDTPLRLVIKINADKVGTTRANLTLGVESVLATVVHEFALHASRYGKLFKKIRDKKLERGVLNGIVESAFTVGSYLHDETAHDALAEGNDPLYNELISSSVSAIGEEVHQQNNRGWSVKGFLLERDADRLGHDVLKIFPLKASDNDLFRQKIAGLREKYPHLYLQSLIDIVA